MGQESFCARSWNFVEKYEVAPPSVVLWRFALIAVLEDEPVLLQKHVCVYIFMDMYAHMHMYVCMCA